MAWACICILNFCALPLPEYYLFIRLLHRPILSHLKRCEESFIPIWIEFSPRRRRLEKQALRSLTTNHLSHDKTFETIDLLVSRVDIAFFRGSLAKSKQAPRLRAAVCIPRPLSAQWSWFICMFSSNLCWQIYTSCPRFISPLLVWSLSLLVWMLFILL